MKVDKFQMYYNLMERWLTVHEEGKSIGIILKNRGLGKIAVYGLGKIGKHVVHEVSGSDITVLYGIDRAKAGIYNGLPVKKLDDIFPEVDAVIVTVIDDFDKIEILLKEKVSCPIISLEEILYEG